MESLLMTALTRVRIHALQVELPTSMLGMADSTRNLIGSGKIRRHRSPERGAERH